MTGTVLAGVVEVVRVEDLVRGVLDRAGRVRVEDGARRPRPATGAPSAVSPTLTSVVAVMTEYGLTVMVYVPLASAETSHRYFR